MVQPPSVQHAAAGQLLAVDVRPFENVQHSPAHVDKGVTAENGPTVVDDPIEPGAEHVVVKRDEAVEVGRDDCYVADARSAEAESLRSWLSPFLCCSIAEQGVPS